MPAALRGVLALALLRAARGWARTMPTGSRRALRLGAGSDAALAAVAPLSSPEAFQAWLSEKVASSMKNDQEFQRKVALRKLRGEHADELAFHHNALEEANRSYTGCANAERIAALEREVSSLEQMVTSMEALTRKDPAELKPKEAAKREKVLGVIPEKREELSERRGALAALCTATPEHSAREAAAAALDAFEEAIGLRAVEARVREAQRRGGRSRGASGAGFEQQVAAHIEENIMPGLAAAHGIEDPDNLKLIRNVMLGMGGPEGATGELDACICRCAAYNAEEPVEVLAVVEVKRNPEDIGPAFSRYQQTLQWLAGARGAYDAETWRTKTHSTGHFEKTVKHVVSREEGTFVRFGPDSFRGLWEGAVDVDNLGRYQYGGKYSGGTKLNPDPNLNSNTQNNSNATAEKLILLDLFFATPVKKEKILDIPSEAMRRLLGRVATEGVGDDLYGWLCAELQQASPFATSGVVELYERYAPGNLVVLGGEDRVADGDAASNGR
uniref:Uncharacterized protein n=2 Tax=Phaeomonas parva TaxID=124430 RepID=A0A6U4LM82_9STRA|mmetsp:Transcript_8579/g.24815  ORF Transcript_8579/g.24815 Transcript_8579/m.24815 type:complete len:501 (+) Transcript_8579:180-1682(+)